MVSFRNNQFQAVLVGMIIADAVSCGQLPWPLNDRGGPVQGDRFSDVPAGVALTSDRWCHHLVQQFEQIAKGDLVAIRNQSHPKTVSTLTTTAQLEALLMGLPAVLIHSDLGAAACGKTVAMTQIDDDSQRFGIEFYQCLLAGLNNDRAAIMDLRDRLNCRAISASERLTHVVSTAVEQVVQAEGDFCLAVGQSLYTAPPLPGLPVFTGILSAGWVGIRGLPISAFQALQMPEGFLQQWLRRRWPGATAPEITAWANGLWRQWSGSLTPTLWPTAVAVHPVRYRGW